MHTKIVTTDNREITIPNGEFAKDYEKLPKHGIRFPFPQLDVHMRTDA